TGGGGHGGGAGDGAPGQHRAGAEGPGKGSAPGGCPEQVPARNRQSLVVRHGLSLQLAGWFFCRFGCPAMAAVRPRSGTAPTLARRFIFLITTGQVVSDWYSTWQCRQLMHSFGLISPVGWI